jgi:thioredoxin reductase
MSRSTTVAIIGAGPYGLSIAAHLRARGVDHRIFGAPMQFWRSHMPRGMHLKSEGFASDLYDPKGEFRLRDFCAERGIRYADVGVPIERLTFCAYGEAFARRYVPDLEDRRLVALERSADGFALELDDGDRLHARHVVLAIGIDRFAHTPETLAHLPAYALSHSSDHSDAVAFHGRDVVVLGAGASAVDTAAALAESGARVRLIARRAALPFAGTGPWPSKRSVLGRIRTPMTGIGPGWKSRFFCDAPLAFHRLPQSYRLRAVKSHLGPSAGYFMRERVLGRVPLLLRSTVERADASGDRVHLRLATPEGTQDVTTEHVIAATGYRVDVRSLGFLSDAIRTELDCVERTPVLSSNFESSVRGLYFVGAASANSFGPMMRFTFGAGFAARRLTAHFG